MGSIGLRATVLLPVVAVAVVGVGIVDVVGALLCGRVIGGVGVGVGSSRFGQRCGWGGTSRVVSFVPLVLTSLVWPWWGLPHLVVIRYAGVGHKISIARNKKEE